jgi:hypothetical protein
MHGSTDPRSCAISLHLTGKKLPGEFNLILSGYILDDAWGKNMGFKGTEARTLALSTLIHEHAKSAFWAELLTTCVLNVQTNVGSIGISQIEPIPSISYI